MSSFIDKWKANVESDIVPLILMTVLIFGCGFLGWYARKTEKTSDAVIIFIVFIFTCLAAWVVYPTVYETNMNVIF